ncbi:transglutaminase-like cysteine peptidase [Kumtagia ephedrae]|jgi:predicted transglutaminase-like cysteine proteinase|uniref:Transglutaminase n=1 Tax=Kumtagia ephedrae TaxID=2116701 RepID=A0A2P7S6D7_9HYPH|nr:transglutaminase-like cysteine peptidase [Mesorhizobium ephedrae]PSJ58048.1 transglutaminase [Mesorhizobium ephedrae]
MQSSPRARRAAKLTGIVLASAMASLIAGAASASGPMLTGGLTSQPIGHYEFCKINRAECSIRVRDAGPERMSGALWSLLVGINTDVNGAVKPMNDFDIYGKDEVWAYPDDGVGDCEDYVLEKRRQLQAGGLSLSNLLITVVRKPDGEGHAVLTVRTDKGDFVLDNLSNEVKDWSQTGYRFLKRQASNHTGRWVTIREGSAPLVGAVQ